MKKEYIQIGLKIANIGIIRMKNILEMTNIKQ